jgi:replication factor A1
LTKQIRRYDGSQIRQAECVVGDESGVMDMLALNDQIDKVKVGETITVRNGLAKVLRETGRIKLIVDKWGKVETAAQDVKIASVDSSNNISAVEYELVRESSRK